MKQLLSEIRGAVVSTFVLAIACCGIYPLIVCVIGQAIFPAQAGGSLIADESGAIRGSRLIGQQFSGAHYFHSRPSAAGAGYDASASGGSNLGPTSRKLHEAVKERIAAYRHENGLSDADPVPADAVTASGSGLDPHISMANAQIQARRVAAARKITEEAVRRAIKENTAPRGFATLGEPGVNVLLLNLALDKMGRPAK